MDKNFSISWSCAVQRVLFTFTDWVNHRSTSRYARHIGGILG